MSFYLFVVIPYSHVVPYHSHWLIYHVFLFPKWFDTQNAAQCFSPIRRMCCCDFRLLPTLITARSHVPSNAYALWALTGVPYVLWQEFCWWTRTNDDDDDNLPFSTFRFLRPNLNRLFIRIYYIFIHSFGNMCLHSPPPPPSHEQTNRIKRNRTKKKQKTKWGNNFPTGKHISMKQRMHIRRSEGVNIPNEIPFGIRIGWEFYVSAFVVRKTI